MTLDRPTSGWRWPAGGLTFKLALTVLLVELVAMLCLGFYYSQRFNQQVDNEMLARVRLPGQLMTRGLLSYDAVERADVMHNLVGDGVVDALILGLDGNVFHSLDPGRKTEVYSAFLGLSPAELRQLPPEGRVRVEAETGRSYVTSLTPLLAAAGQFPFAFAYIRVSAQGADQAKASITRTFVMGGAVVLLVTWGVITGFIYRVISRRVHRLMDVTRRLGQGELSARVTLPPAADDLGRLQEGVNSMAGRLEQTIRELRDKIGELDEAHQNLRQQKGFLDTLLGHLPVAVSVKNARNGFRHEYWNRRATELFGVAPEAVLGRSDRDWLSPAEAAAREEKEAAALQSPVIAEGIEEVPAPDGGRRQLRTLRVPIRDGQGSPLYLLTIAEDVTEQRRAEEVRQRLESQLRQAQKIEAIGRLAGGIAHDFNNILAAIIPAAQMAREDAAEQPAVRENLDEVLKAAERARKLVQQILAFSRQSKQERRVIALGPVVREALRMLRAVLPASVEIVEHFDAAVPTVRADATQIHQIIVNLCTNAEHAMRGRPGRLEVSLLAYEAGPEDVQRRAGMRPGPHARITVRDNGHGMEPDVLKRIFDPFFTTKAPGEGTGLGLAVVHGIVQEHEGVIEVYSQPAKGTSFHLFLPACAAGPEAATEAPTAIPRGQGERILYVDDERAVCEVAQRTLEKRGYRVVWHTNPQEAVAQFTVSPRQFDLVFTDLTMPGMTGVDLALHVLAVRPDVPVILATGFGGAWTSENARRLGIREVLLKPIGQDELSLAIHRTLRAQDRPPLPGGPA